MNCILDKKKKVLYEYHVQVYSTITYIILLLYQVKYIETY